MVDNVTLSAGTADGAVIATDDIGGVHYQYNKIGIGAGDTFTILVGGAGAVAAGVQRVTLASDDPAVALLGTIDADTGGIATSLAVMDDWDNGASDGASVSGDVAHDGVDAGEPVKIGGYAKAAAPTDVSADGDRVNAWFDLAGRLQVGDGGSTLSIDDGGGAITVDGTVAVTNGGLTELAAAINASSQMDVNIAASNATITVASHAVTNAGTFAVQVDGAALTALQLIDDPVATLGTTTYTETSTKGMIIGAVRRDADTTLVDTTNEIGPLQMDANGYLKVEIFDGGGSHTVDNAGTFAVQVDGNALTALQLIDDIVYTDDTSTHSTGSSKGALIMAAAAPTDTAVNANDIGAVGMTVNRELYVSLTTALPAGSAAIGKLAANSGVDIGDVDILSIVPGTGATNLGKAEDGGHTTGDVGVMALGVRTDVPNAVGAGTTADYSFLATDMAGGLRTALYETDFAVLGTNHVKKYYTNAGAVTDGIVWSPAAGKRWYVTDIIMNVSAAATVTFEDDKAGGDEAIAKFELAANSGIAHSFATPWFSGEDAADLLVTTSAGNIYITVTGYEI